MCRLALHSCENGKDKDKQEFSNAGFYRRPIYLMTKRRFCFRFPAGHHSPLYPEDR